MRSFHRAGVHLSSAHKKRDILDIQTPVKRQPSDSRGNPDVGMPSCRISPNFDGSRLPEQPRSLITEHHKCRVVFLPDTQQIAAELLPGFSEILPVSSLGICCYTHFTTTSPDRQAKPLSGNGLAVLEEQFQGEPV